MRVILPEMMPNGAVDVAGASTAVLDAVVRPEGASDLARFSQRMRALSSLSTQLVCASDGEPPYAAMVEGVWRVLGCDSAGLYLFDGDTQRLQLRGAAGCQPQDHALALTLNDDFSTAVQAFNEEYSVHVPEVATAPGLRTLAPGVRASLAVPVLSATGPIAVFEFGRLQACGFNPTDVDMAGMLVDQMAYQFENFRLMQRLSESRDAVIHGMAMLAESRDGSIGGHIERMCAYSRLLASRLQRRPEGIGRVGDEFVETLARAAALHDIGKVGIPDRILLKPGRLDEDEFAIMRTHAVLGGQILDELIHSHGSFTMLEMGAEVAIAHHERWDGGGYPNRLRGEEIPLAARIVAIADVYDALTSKRCYKDAWSHADSLGALREGQGTQFDPVLLEIFLDGTDELLAIRARYPD